MFCLLLMCWFFESVLQLLKLHKIKRKKAKTENTTNKHSRARTKDLRGSAICLHPRESAAPHHHIDHEITSSIQAAASFDLSWFLSSKTSLNLLALFLY